MTVEYESKSHLVEKWFGTRLLFIWNKGVLQVIWKQLLIYLAIYYCLCFTYQCALAYSPSSQATFACVGRWFAIVKKSTPLAFLLGFFVANMVSRWWDVVKSLPWMTSPTFIIRSLVTSKPPRQPEDAARVQLALARYMNLSWLLAMSQISSSIRRRFRCLDTSDLDSSNWLSIEERLAGVNQDTVVRETFGEIATRSEVEAMTASFEVWERMGRRKRKQKRRRRGGRMVTEEEAKHIPDFRLPLAWATSLLNEAKKAEFVPSDPCYLRLLQTINDFQNSLTTMMLYGKFRLPPIYTQVVMIGVYTSLLAGIVSALILESNVTGVDPNDSTDARSNIWHNPMLILHFIPLTGILEFVFYLGWFQIGCCLLDPFGTDELDLPLGDVFDSNLKTSVRLLGIQQSLFPDDCSLDSCLQRALPQQQQNQLQVQCSTEASSRMGPDFPASWLREPTEMSDLVV